MTRCLHLPLSVLLFLAGCDASHSQPVSVSEGTLTDGRYHHPGLGWRMSVPPGWTVMSIEDIRSYTGKGRELVEKSLGEDIEENQTDLLYLRGGAHSAFTSARQPIDESDGPYSETQKALFEVVAQAYRTAGIPIRIERRQETIAGVTFELMHVSLRSREGNHEIAQQYMYDARIGQQSLTVSVTAGDAEEREQGLRAWRASTFENGADAAAKNPAPPR